MLSTMGKSMSPRVNMVFGCIDVPCLRAIVDAGEGERAWLILPKAGIVEWLGSTYGDNTAERFQMKLSKQPER
jgi:hypothetical protein